MTDDDPQRDGLIDAVYDLALDPHNFDSFTEAFEQFIEDHGLSDNPDPELTEALAKHFERAFLILEKIGRAGHVGVNSVEQFVRDRKSPSIAVNHHGKLLAINNEAMGLFNQQRRAGFAQDLIHEDSAKSLLAALDKLSKAESPTPVLVLLQNRLPALMLLQQMTDSDAIIIDVSGSSWDKRVDRTLKDMYGFTERECQIASLLYQGMSINDIAESQHRSQETVRKHTKSLLAKTETNSQPKLMRLLTSLNFANSNDNQAVWNNSQCSNYSIRTSDGRNLAYYDTGGNSDKVVAVMHGIIHDPELPIPIHQALLREGYRVIGMSRAWYGESSPPRDTEHILDTAANDLNAILDHLKIPTVTLLGTLAGSIHAFAFAATFPGRVNHIVNLAGVVPIRSDEQFRKMPKALRAIARTARYFPRLLPTLVRTAVALIDSGDISKLFQSGYRNSPVDMAATRDPNILARLSTGYKFTVHHGYAAYASEGAAVMQNTSRYVDQVSCPIDFIHGQYDRATSIESVQQFCDEIDHARLITIDDGGQLISFTHPEVLRDHLIRVLKGAS